MKRTHFRGFDFVAPPDSDADEEIPALVFEVEMYEGRDWDGKFQHRFAVAELHPDEPARFVMATPSDELLAVFDYEEPAIQDLLDELIRQGRFLACINYNNLEWEDYGGGIVLPLLGRSLGEEFDWTEQYDLEPEDVEALRECREHLQRIYDVKGP